MRLGPSLLPDSYSGRSTRHRPAAAPGKRLALRIGTLQLHGIARSLDAQQFGRALERNLVRNLQRTLDQTLQATPSGNGADKLPTRKYQAVISARNLRASAGSSEVAQHLAALLAGALSDEQQGDLR